MRDKNGRFIKGHTFNLGRKRSQESIERMKNSNNEGWFKKGSDMSKTREYKKYRLIAKVRCLICGKEFSMPVCSIKRGRGKYCSRKCTGVHNGILRRGENCNFYIDGRAQDEAYRKKLKKICGQRRKALMKDGGALTIQTIQRVYENNIKKYGTLTCIYCLEPIQFGKDTLEHKIPLSRGGTNEYKNLAIACQKCNSSKHTKTEKEFRRWANFPLKLKEK